MFTSANGTTDPVWDLVVFVGDLTDSKEVCKKKKKKKKSLTPSTRTISSHGTL